MYLQCPVIAKRSIPTSAVTNPPDHYKEAIMANKDNFAEEEMTVTLELDDGATVVCSIVTILEVQGKDYIVLLPLDENGENEDGEVWFYGYSENPDDPNEEPALEYIESDEEYELVADAFDEFLDTVEYDEIVEEEE